MACDLSSWFWFCKTFVW